MNSPLLPLFLALTSGVLMSRYVPVAFSYIIVILVAVGFVLLLVKQRYTAIMLVAVAVGILVNEVDAAQHAPLLPTVGKEINAEGRVVGVSTTETSTLVIVNLENGYHGRCLLTVTGCEPDIIAGQKIQFTGKFHEPHVSLDVEDDVDYNEFYYRNYISSCSYIEPENINVTGVGNRVDYFFATQRERCKDIVVCANLSPGARHFLVAVLLGDASMLDDSVRPRFAAAGLSHVLALSGMHVAIIAMLLSMILLPVTYVFNRRVTQVVLIAGLWFYAFLTGLSPSVTRATIMLSMVLIAKIAGRANSSLNALSLAAIVILLFSPRQIYAPGFQLSFVAVFMLIVMPTVLPRVSKKHFVAHYIYNYVVYTLAATIGTLPLAIFYFQQIPLYSVLSNIPCAFILPIMLGAGLFMLLLGLMGVDVGMFDKVIDWCYSVIDKTCSGVLHIPYASIENIYLNWWEVVLIYMLLGMILLCLKWRKGYLYVAAAGLSTMIIGCFMVWPQSSDCLFISRNSQATDVIYTEAGKATLISTGHSTHRHLSLEHYNQLYRKFLVKRNTGNLQLYDADFTHKNFTIQYGSRNLMFINSNVVPTDTSGVDYMIVTAGFSGDILQLVGKVNCDSVILSADIRASRCAMYERRLDEVGMNYRSLARGAGFSINL